MLPSPYRNHAALTTNQGRPTGRNNMNTQATQFAKAARATKASSKVSKAATAPVQVAATVASAKPNIKLVKPAKPVIPAYNTQTSYAGESTLVNMRPSKTPIDFSRFGKSADAPMTDRDLKSLEGIRRDFGNKTFMRANYDAGVIRRLGERGYVAHVSGSEVAPDATFRLTAKTGKTLKAQQPA